MRPKCALKHRGARAELAACHWLLEQGYEVFRNVSYYGHADVVAFRDGEFLRIDVKSGRSALTTEQLNAGIAALYVYADGRCELDRAPKVIFRVCQTCGRTFRARKDDTQYCGWRCGYDARRAAERDQSQAAA
jgi:hypothetical protein